MSDRDVHVHIWYKLKVQHNGVHGCYNLERNLLHAINCLIRLLVVKEIKAARRERKDVLMWETFEERRKWVTQSKELDPTI